MQNDGEIIKACSTKLAVPRTHFRLMWIGFMCFLVFLVLVLFFSSGALDALKCNMKYGLLISCRVRAGLTGHLSQDGNW